jgi:hypothetical protein
VKTVLKTAFVVMIVLLAIVTTTPLAQQASIISQFAGGWLVGARSDGADVYIGSDGVPYLKVARGGAISLVNGSTFTGGGTVGCDENGIVNVLCHGAAGDGRQVVDAVTTEDSTTVTSATATFVSARDVGKLVWGSKQVGGPVGNPLAVPLGTIVSVTNATTIEVSIAAVSSETGVSLMWGTDDTEALQDAFALAYNSALPGPKPTIYLPAGMYIYGELLADWRSADRFGVPVIEGAGSKNTTFVYKPNFDFNTVISGRGMIVATSADSISDYRHFAVTGNAFRFAGTQLDWAIVLTGSAGSIRDVNIHHVQASPAGAEGGVHISSCGNFEITARCVADDLTVTAVAGHSLRFNSSIAIVRNFLTLEFESLTVGNGSNVIFEAGNFGDHGPSDNRSVLVNGGATATFYGGSRVRHEIELADANTRVHCDACILNDTVEVGAGTVFTATNSRFLAVTDGIWIQNAGDAFDLGGNQYVDSGEGGEFGTAAPYGSSFPTTFTLLPTCDAGGEGQRNMVTDSNTATWGANVAGSGANRVLAYCNGTNWTLIGK